MQKFSYVQHFGRSYVSEFLGLITIFFKQFYLFINFLLYNIVLVLPYIDMNLPWVYMCSPSWTSLPYPSPSHPSGSSQCTSPELLLLLLLSRSSRVRLCATPETEAHQAPPSLGFSRQKHWSGLPFPSPVNESEKWKGSVRLLATPWTTAYQAPPSHGIFQARVLEWGAIAF